MSNKSKDAGPKQPDSSFIQFDDAKQQDAASAASAPRRKALVSVLTAVCIALIVVSLGFVHPSESGAWSIEWIVQTVTGESVVAKDATGSGSPADSGKADSKDSKSSNDAKDESKDSDESKDDSESSNKESDKSSDDKKSGEKGAGNKKAEGNQSTSQNSTTSGGASSASGGSSAASDNGNASAGDQGASQEPSYVTVTVSVSSSAVGNPVSSGGTFTFNEGATVYDALCALGLSVNAHGSSYGTYVAAIGGLAEKQYGGTSGWMYSVNGVTPMTACSNYVLSNGDNVVWYYVTG
ncbi:MAG: DUF4430 domain-containing protein [Collinsella sp.]|nr:DUF4430 domain-containing protein [Collinsella sp.]